MTADPAVAVTLMTQEVESATHAPTEGSPAQPSPALARTPPPPPPHTLNLVPGEEEKRKTSGSSRRGKQYKCGNCHELGHNQKTCPRRAAAAAAAGEAAAQIQPALGVDASELFGSSNVAPALPGTVVNGHGHHVAVARLQPCKLDAALEAANKRVIAADKLVANSTTEAEFEETTAALDSAVRHLEKVASCAQRCAMVAHTLAGGGGGWDAGVERESKRLRMDGGSVTPGALTPTTLAINEATAGAAEGVDGGDVVTEVKEDAVVE